ncbi:MAG TPA: response regulator transcription factor [Chloroflexota bacterium]|nr:response regulator transcription factor [Chloroflexota bacterium]
MIRVVIADDHLVVREGLRLILEGQEEFTLVGDAADGEAVVALVADLQPDVALIDLRMPGMGGLEAVAQIHRAWPRVALVILTTYNDDDLMLQALQAGACGYLIKDTTRETLFQAIRAAARGETLLQPETMARLLARTTAAPARGHGMLDLTARELEVLDGVVRGERNKEIAVRLGLTEPTVKTHLASIFGKLGVDSRAAAAVAAIERGLVSRQ